MNAKQNPHRVEPWALTQLAMELQNDLAQCQSESERINVRAIGGREILGKAVEFSKTRKLTPCELSIAQEFGFDN